MDTIFISSEKIKTSSKRHVLIITFTDKLLP